MKNAKELIKGAINTNIFPILITGGPGIGKLAVVEEILNEVGKDFVLINSQIYNNHELADVINDKESNKVLVINEVDYLYGESFNKLIDIIASKNSSQLILLSNSKETNLNSYVANKLTVLNI